MYEFDVKAKLMTWKIVYYGPALSGKTTNLLSLHDRISPAKRGQMMEVDTKEDRTLFFDLLPVAYQTRSGARLKIKFFTVPGQVQYNATRKAVLMRADGVVFIADSQKAQSFNNSESFKMLMDNSRQVGLDFDTLPLVIQYNKRDLPENSIVSEDEVLNKWRSADLPVVFSSALHGRGVMETLEAILKGVYRRVDQKYQISNNFGLVEEELLKYLIEKQDEGQGGNEVANYRSY